MMKNRLLYIFLFSGCMFFISSQNAWGQAIYQLDLNEVVELAQSDAPDALLASTRWKRNYWTHQSFLADYKPNIIFSANTLPLFNRSIEPVTQPDGQDIYVERAYMNNSMNIGITQDVALTGGTVYLGTGLNRLDVFATSGGPASLSYLSNPINFGFVQPLFQFNAMKWERDIEPLRYRESEKLYSEQMESVANQAAGFFFNLLISQLDAEAAIRDKANADTLLILSKGRYEVGKIAETDLLQVE